MTFDKYKEGREKYNDALFPEDGYEYDYVLEKDLGWIVKKGNKISEVRKMNGMFIEEEIELTEKQNKSICMGKPTDIKIRLYDEEGNFVVYITTLIPKMQGVK